MSETPLQNYQKLNTLLPSLPRIPEYAKSTASGFMDLHLDRLEKKRGGCCYVARPLTQFIASSLARKSPIGVPFRAHPYRRPERNTLPPRESGPVKEKRETSRQGPFNAIRATARKRVLRDAIEVAIGRDWLRTGEMDFTETPAPARLI